MKSPKVGHEGLLSLHHRSIVPTRLFKELICQEQAQTNIPRRHHTLAAEIKEELCECRAIRVFRSLLKALKLTLGRCVDSVWLFVFIQVINVSPYHCLELDQGSDDFSLNILTTNLELFHFLQ